MPTLLSVIDRLLDRGFVASIAILVTLGFLVYFNALGLPFVHDDIVFIQQNPNIQRWDNLTDAFFRPAIPQFFQGLVTPYYRPVLEVVYRLEFLLFGFHPAGYHFINILIHVVNGLLFYGIMRRISQARKMSLVAAAIFLVHPVQTEAVACVSGISNVMCAFFMMLAFDGYLRAQQWRCAHQMLWLAYALMMFAVA
ncbi:MAG: glycosyltransferase family 39 protein, partial [Candidatus Omnitrophica bacterium]|nr:glycosyltransferase family 39 protein [Candidatus Omnitrophota bacterium]